MLSVFNLSPGQSIILRNDVMGTEREYQFHSYEAPRYRGTKGKVWLFNPEDCGLAGEWDKGLTYLTLQEFKQRGRLA